MMGYCKDSQDRCFREDLEEFARCQKVKIRTWNRRLEIVFLSASTHQPPVGSKRVLLINKTLNELLLLWLCHTVWWGCCKNLGTGLTGCPKSPPGLRLVPIPRSSCVAILGSLELLTSRPEDGDGGDFPFETPLTAFFPTDVELVPPAGRGSGDKSKSDSGDEAYERREVIGNKKSSDRYSSNYEGVEGW